MNENKASPVVHEKGGCYYAHIIGFIQITVISVIFTQLSKFLVLPCLAFGSLGSKISADIKFTLIPINCKPDTGAALNPVGMGTAAASG